MPALGIPAAKCDQRMSRRSSDIMSAANAVAPPSARRMLSPALGVCITIAPHPQTARRVRNNPTSVIADSAALPLIARGSEEKCSNDDGPFGPAKKHRFHRL
jgi:hypothetical protein